ELKEYKKLYNERHTFEQSEEKFEAARKQAAIKLGYNSLEYNKWIEDNSDYQITDAFYNKHNRLKLEKKVFVYSGWNKDTKIMDYMNSADIQALNDYDFVEAINKYITNNKLESSMQNSDMNTDEQDNEILELTKPFKRGNTYDYMDIPLATYQRLNELQKEIYDITNPES